MVIFLPFFCFFSDSFVIALTWICSIWPEVLALFLCTSFPKTLSLSFFLWVLSCIFRLKYELRWAVFLEDVALSWTTFTITQVLSSMLLVNETCCKPTILRLCNIIFVLVSFFFLCFELLTKKNKQLQKSWILCCILKWKDRKEKGSCWFVFH